MRGGVRREEGGAEAEEGKLLLNEIRMGAACVVRTVKWMEGDGHT